MSFTQNSRPSPSDIPDRAGDTVAEYHELHAVEAGDGRITVQIRNHNAASAGETLQCESSDGGHRRLFGRRGIELSARRRNRSNGRI
jgi:hypothetical protein